MNKIEMIQKDAARANLKVEVVKAPQDANTFDQLILVRREGSKFIQSVTFYDSKTDQIVNRV